MMETEALSNLSRDEMFEVLKDKCKSRGNTTICSILIFLLAAILVMIDVWQKLDDIKGRSG